MEHTSPDLGPGYQVVELLGKGAAGEVYRAENLTLGRTEAIKVLAPIAEDASFAARFRREAKASGRLDHPNIVRVYDSGELPDGRPYLSMEFAAGTTVAAYLDRRGALPIATVLSILGQLAEAVAHAHERGVIHRDLKPHNLVLTDGGVLKVLDFGLAKIIAPDHTDSVVLTKSGDIFGSPPYMAPEQFRGLPPAPCMDIYAIGCIGYELLVGETPFSGSLLELMKAHVSTTPTTPSDADPDAGIPPELDQFILRCMEKEAEFRYPDATTLRAAIERVPGYERVAPAPAPVPATAPDTDDCAAEDDDTQEALTNGEPGAAHVRRTQAPDPPAHSDQQAVLQARAAAWTLASALMVRGKACANVVSAAQMLQALSGDDTTAPLRHAIDTLTRDRQAAGGPTVAELDLQIQAMCDRLATIAAETEQRFVDAYRTLRDALDPHTRARSDMGIVAAELDAYTESRHLL